MVEKWVGGLVGASSQVMATSKSKPPHGTQKYNIDATIFLALCCSGVGDIVRDSACQFVVATSSFFRGCVNPQYAEIMGLHFALGWLFQYFNGPSIIECDAQEIVLFRNALSKDLTKFGLVLDDCRLC